MAYRDRKNYLKPEDIYYRVSEQKMLQNNLDNNNFCENSDQLNLTQKNQSQSFLWAQEENYKNTHKCQNKQFEFEIIPPSEENRINRNNVLEREQIDEDDELTQKRENDFLLTEEARGNNRLEFLKIEKFEAKITKNPYEDAEFKGRNTNEENEEFYCESIKDNKIQVFSEEYEDSCDLKPFKKNFNTFFQQHQFIQNEKGTKKKSSEKFKETKIFSEKINQTESNYSAILQSNSEHIIKIQDLEKEKTSLKKKLDYFERIVKNLENDLVMKKENSCEKILNLKDSEFKIILQRIADSSIASLFKKFFCIPSTLKSIIREIFFQVENFLKKKLQKKIFEFNEIFEMEISSEMSLAILKTISRKENCITKLKIEEIIFMKSKLQNTLLKLLEDINCGKNDTFNPKKIFRSFHFESEEGKNEILEICNSQLFEEMLDNIYQFYLFLELNDGKLKFEFPQHEKIPIPFDPEKMNLLDNTNFTNPKNDYVEILPGVMTSNGEFYLNIKPYYLSLPELDKKRDKKEIKFCISPLRDKKEELRSILMGKNSIKGEIFDSGDCGTFNGSFGYNSGDFKDIMAIDHKSSLYEIKLKKKENNNQNRKSSSKIMIVREKPAGNNKSLNLRKRRSKRNFKNLRSAFLDDSKTELSRQRSKNRLKLSNSRKKLRKSSSKKIPRSPLINKKKTKNNKENQDSNAIPFSRKTNLLRVKRKKGDSYSKKIREVNKKTKFCKKSPNIKSHLRVNKSFHFDREIKKNSSKKRLSSSYYDRFNENEIEKNPQKKFSKEKMKNELLDLRAKMNGMYSRLIKIRDKKEKGSEKIYLY